METKDDIIKDVTSKLYRLMNKHARLEALPIRLPAGTKLTHRELHAIEVIGQRDHTSVTDLGRQFGVTKSAASQMVSKLVGKNLVRKRHATDSDKEYRLSLTKLGRRAFQLHEEMHSAHLAELIGRLGVLSLSQIATTSVVLDIMEGTVDARMEERLGGR